MKFKTLNADIRFGDLEIVECLGIGNSVLCNHLYCVIIGKLYLFGHFTS